MADVPVIRSIFPEKYFSKLKRKRGLSFIKLKEIKKRKHMCSGAEHRKTIKKEKYNLKPMTSNTNTSKPVPQDNGSYESIESELFEWQYQHRLAYWKYRASKLEIENRYLREHIRNLSDTQNDESMSHSLYQEDRRDTRDNIQNERRYVHVENKPEDDSDSDYEISEEFTKFIEENRKHRESVQKEKKERLKNDDMKFEIVEDNATIKDEMVRLYGEGASKIAAFETTMQVSYDYYVKKHKPKHWPNIPLNL